MGLSIHYSGRFKPGSSLTELIHEVKEFLEIFQWNYHVFEEAFPQGSMENPEHDDNIYGISFSPPECEPVCFTFLSTGRMSAPHLLEFWGKAVSSPEKGYLYMLSTKTQYAGPEVHKTIIHLFKYVEKKYLTDFKLIDEGKYWETGDEKLLLEIFRKYSVIIDNFQFGLAHIPKEEDESTEEYCERLMKFVHRRLSGEK